ncbi:hypothetical protein CFC21_073116 [Triticum aestivum]|uniref:Uncharacterized protein n=3 Tax=Triticum TaxID=4564 RepID=A0A9R0XF05_TRITD|nr:hypothetical protein CFC21_073116 [Triticum aestivum]VAI35543.1 unnamed protein product [Triticum turgidum subsp. durum]
MLTMPTVDATEKFIQEEETSGSNSPSPTARERRRRGGYSLHVKPCGGLKRRMPAADSGGDHRAVEATREALALAAGEPRRGKGVRGPGLPGDHGGDDHAAEHNHAIVAAFRTTAS